MDAYEKALSLLNPALAGAIRRLGPEGVEEIRLRLGKRPSLLLRGRELRVNSPEIGRGELERVLEKASGASYHMAAGPLSEGYLNWEGLRLGVCGTVSRSADGRQSFHSFWR